MLLPPPKGSWLPHQGNFMNIRRAKNKDIPKINDLLTQVLKIHADIRPDIFIPDTTKYTNPELEQMVLDDQNPIFVATDDKDEVIGYAFCRIKEPYISNNMIPFKSFFIDDLCVDQTVRGMNIGRHLFEFAKEEAKRLGCYELTLNVWEGNDTAKHFYEKMGMSPKKTLMQCILEEKN